MHKTIDAELPAHRTRIAEVLRDLGNCPRWLDIVRRADPAAAAPGDAGPAWMVTLRAKVGPLARSKRLRMVRTVDTAHHLRFERAETDELLNLLGQRQRLLDAALTSAHRLEPFVEQWEDFMGALPEEQRTVCVARVRKIQDRIDRIGSRDERDRADLAKQRNELTTELAGVGRSRGAIAAYASPNSRTTSPRFQDRNG